MKSPRKKSPPLAVRLLLWMLPLIFIALIAGFLIFHVWFNAYLESPAFRQLIGVLTSTQMKAAGEYQPFHFSGTAIYSDAFKARGSAKTFFSELEANQIRAEINLGGLWKKAWEIDEINVQRLEAVLGHTDTAGASAQEPEAAGGAPKPAEANPLFNWLPKKVDLRKIVIHDTNLKWGENSSQPGSVSGAMFTLIPDGDAWNIAGENGAVSQRGGPDLSIDHMRLRYQRPSLFITEAQFRNNGGGTVDLSGEVDFESKLDVLAKLNKVPVTPFLREDWRAKLRGNLSGEVRTRGALPLQGAPAAEGSLSLAQGELEALPVLDQIAAFTRTQSFRKLNLSRMSAKFTQARGRTTVTDFVAESQGLICVEGGFTVENSSIDGTFQVGVTPSSLQWLPGSQSKVFTVSRNGYLWTRVRLTGPVNSPKEDLSQRLVAAAGGAVIETIQSTIQELPKGNLPDAPKKIIDTILSPLLK
jgi:hypothetical protein